MKKLLLFIVIVAGAIWFWWQSFQTDDVYRRIAQEITEVATTVTELTTEAEPEIEEVIEIVRSTDVIDAFFYNQLDEESRLIYRIIRDGIIDYLEEITIKSDDIDLIHDIYNLVLFDHPEFFWVTGAGTTTVTSWTDGRVYANFKPDYGHSQENKIIMKGEIEAVVDGFLQTVEADLTEYEKVRMVYEFLIFNTTYNLEAPDHQNIYSVFVNQESVCAGISKAAQLLLNRLGIFATYVVGEAYIPGTSEQPIGHAWNLVRVNGEYYYLDVTWGLPSFGEDDGLANRINIIYDYLLLTGELLYKTHTLSPGIIMPEVNSLTHTFFYLNNMFYDTNDRDILLEAMNTSILNSEPRTAFQFATPELFEEMRTIIIEELAPIAAHNLMEWHGLMSTQYFFRERENLNKITIYWTYE